MNTKSILLFVGGLGLGAAAGVLGTRKFFQTKYSKQFNMLRDELEKYYNEVDEFARKDHNADEIEDNDVNPTEDGESAESEHRVPRMSDDERAAIKEKLNRNWAGTTNYAGMYRERNGYTEHKLAEGEHPTDEDDEEEDDSALSTPEEDAFDDHRRDMNKPPKLISAEAYGSLPAHIEQDVLYFYAYDEMLCDDNEEPVEEPERLVGDALTKYGFVDNDERIIFVMNYALDTCYEIQKVDASWTDSH